jgi:cadmium resistance protein CadD (predicted permease)
MTLALLALALGVDNLDVFFFCFIRWMAQASCRLAFCFFLLVVVDFFPTSARQSRSPKHERVLSF